MRFSFSETANKLSHEPLEILSADVKTVNLRLREPMSLPFGTINERPSGWLRLTGAGNNGTVDGYGEGATLPKPLFTYDSGQNIADNISELTSSLLVGKVATLDELFGALNTYEFADGHSYPTAKICVEMALLDYAAKNADVSLKKFIGLPDSIIDVPYGKSIGENSLDATMRQIEEALQKNARKIKIKIHPGNVAEVTRAIKNTQNDYDNIEVMVDANGSFNQDDKDHLKLLQGIDELDLILIEEPVSRHGSLRDLNAVRKLRQLHEFKTPICLDDCLRTFEDCKTAVDESLAEVINIKPGRIGSFILSLGLVDYSKSQNAKVMVGGMLEATPGRCMTTLLGAYCLHMGFDIPGDLSLAQERLVEDLVIPEKQLQINLNGNISLPDGKGWGF